MSDHEDDTLVGLAGGLVRGVRRGAVNAWLGLPYAEPPVGPRRFRAPEPVAPWSGTRPVVRFGGAATQPAALGVPARELGATVGEDCLYLNVWAPSGASDAPRPVLVWIHGGAFTSGSGALYDGSRLAELGDLVVVTINYRLGVFGFVDLAAAVDAQVTSNLGIRDQIAAVEWVRDNVAAFGGDPTRVTVAGESAGAVGVSLLTCAPAARGLFRAAIIQSGSYSLNHGPETRTEIARAYARQLGLGRGDGDRLWQLPLDRLSAAQAAVNRAYDTTPGAPWFDGDLLPESLAAAQATPRSDLALLAGHNRDEISLFQYGLADVLPTTWRALTHRLQAALGWAEAAAVLEHYPAAAAGTRALGTDLCFALPTLHFAERHAAAGGEAYFYRFDAAVPLLGATHAAELSYLWEWTGLAALLLRGRPTPARDALGARMRQHWVDFVRDARPGSDWPAFTLPERRVLVFDPAGDQVESDPQSLRRAAWGGQDVMPRG